MDVIIVGLEKVLPNGRCHLSCCSFLLIFEEMYLIGVSLCGCVHVWKPKEDLRCHPLSLSASSFGFLGQARSQHTLVILLSPPSLLETSACWVSSLLHECRHPVFSCHCGRVSSASPALCLVCNDTGSFVCLLLLRVTYSVVF